MDDEPTVEPGATPVNVNEIVWVSEPLVPNGLDLLTLDDAEILGYALDLQRDYAVLRELLQEALAALHAANVRHGQNEARIRGLVLDLREARIHVARLAEQVRRLQEAA
jgi:hypothetical protein